MGIHNNTEQAIKVNDNGEVTNTAVSERVGQQPAYLTETIRNADQAVAWLAAHAGVTVSLGKRQSDYTGWNGPTHSRTEDAKGHYHTTAYSNGRSETVKAAKAIQAYMRANPGEYQTTREAVNARGLDAIVRIMTEARKSGDTARANAADRLAAHFQEHQAAVMPRDAFGQTRSGETLPERVARMQNEREALRLFPEAVPQAMLTPGAREAHASAMKRMDQHISGEDWQLRYRREKLQSMLDQIKAGSPPDIRFAGVGIHGAQIDHSPAELKAAGRLLAARLKDNIDAPLKPSPAPKSETEDAKIKRLNREALAHEMWDEAQRQGDRYLTSMLTTAEHQRDNALWGDVKEEYGKLAVARSQRNTADATARAVQQHGQDPMIRALQAGKSLVIRDSNGVLRVVDPKADQGDGAFRLHIRSGQHVNDPSWTKYGNDSTFAGSLGDFARMHLAGEDDTTKAYSSGKGDKWTLEGIYKNPTQAANAIKARPEYATEKMAKLQREADYQRGERDRYQGQRTKAIAEEYQKRADWEARNGKPYESVWPNWPAPEKSYSAQEAARKADLAERKMNAALTSLRTLQKLVAKPPQSEPLDGAAAPKRSTRSKKAKV